MKGHCDIVNILIKYGASVNQALKVKIIMYYIHVHVYLYIENVRHQECEFEGKGYTEAPPFCDGSLTLMNAMHGHS